MSLVNQLVFTVLPFESINDSVLKECAELFSKDYGKWGSKGIKPGSNIKLSAQRLKSQYIFDKTCYICIARLNHLLVGQAVYTKFTSPFGNVIWVTQLVVDSNYRGKKIAQNLLLHSQDTEWSIFGLVSSHPMAIRALEKATGLKCQPNQIQEYANDLLANCDIPYIQGARLICDKKQSLIDTNFFVDHTEVLDLIEREKEKSEWLLGDLLDGYEFFAFVKKH